MIPKPPIDVQACRRTLEKRLAARREANLGLWSMYVKSVNIAGLRGHLGDYLALAEQGEEVQVCRRNRSVARIVKAGMRAGRNATRLGFARGTVQVLGDVVGPAFADDEWEMSR